MAKTLGIKPNEEVVWIETNAKYSFHNPESVNGPFGHFDLNIFSNKSVYGEMEIDTVWALGTKAYLTLKGSYTMVDYNMMIDADGYGTEISPVFKDGKPINECRQVEIAIEITLFMNLMNGNINLHGYMPETFGNGLPAKCVYLDKKYPYKQL